MNKSTLYPRERQVLEFISQFSQRFGYAPTLKEIGEALGMHSVATVHEHIDSLRQKGYVRKLDGVGRGIEVVKGTYTGDDPTAVDLPVLGFIAAGQPLEPYTDPNFYLSAPTWMVAANKPSYILQVKGSSMIDEGILDGDYVLVRQQQTAQEGEVAAVLIGEEATVKRFHKRSGVVELVSENPHVKPIRLTEKDPTIRILGKVVGVIRKL